MRTIKFSPPDISGEEINEVTKVLESGWITTGPETKKLEKMVARFCDADNCVCLNSQTACAEMVLRLLEIGPGDEVIVPAYTYTASCSVILHVGATPILIDSQKNSVEMDYQLLEAAINEKTKAIIPVDLAGCPCDYKKIFEIVERKKSFFRPNNGIQKAIGRVAVLADTAHSFGATYFGKKAGVLADFSSFSFHAVKNVTTAEGGALVWNNINGVDNDLIYHQIQLLSLHGQSKDAMHKNQIGSWEYDVVGPWFKCNMTDILAAVGVAQLSRYDSLLLRRKEIVKKYNDGLKDLDIVVLDHLNNDRQSSCHLYIVHLNHFTEKQRNLFIEKMAEKSIACNVHYKPLPMFTAYKNLGFDIKYYPNAYSFYQGEITLPLHTLLSDDDVKYVIKSFREIYKELVVNEKDQ